MLGKLLKSGLLGSEYMHLVPNILKSIDGTHPLLGKVASYYLKSEGKRLRPQLVLLTGASTNEINAKHYKLAEISEMIHTASLLHDDVIDQASTRRHLTASNEHFGNKLTILAGDYLLAKASVEISRLGDLKVVELMANILQDLVHGEILQMEPEYTIKAYVDKCFYKTASLMANSCQSACILANGSLTLQNDAFDYGKHLGIAFQVIDDNLDCTGVQLGKESQQDLKNGIVTAPVLYAMEKFPEIKEMLMKKEYSKVYEMVLNSDCLEESRNLAERHIKMAITYTNRFPGESRSQMIEICEEILNRHK